MRLDILETIRYLNSADGPHMPLRAIAPYIGVDFSSLDRYLSGKIKPKEETRRRME